NVVRSLGGGERDLYLKVIVPSVLPYIVAGGRIAVGRALVGILVGEFFAASEGIGYDIARFGDLFALDRMFACILVMMAIAVGLPLGVAMGRSKTLTAMFDPFVTAFNATPRLVFLPLIMLWFGLGLWSTVVIVFIGALFPILINTYEGVRNADRVLVNVVRSFGASEWDVARLVVVPNSMPYIIAGLRLAIGRAVLGVVVAEFFGSESGLGVMMV